MLGTRKGSLINVDGMNSTTSRYYGKYMDFGVHLDLGLILYAPGSAL